MPSTTAGCFEPEHSSAPLRTTTTVVEAHHAVDLDAVTALFELRQNHLVELVADGMTAGAEVARDLTMAVPFWTRDEL